MIKIVNHYSLHKLSPHTRCAVAKDIESLTLKERESIPCTNYGINEKKIDKEFTEVCTEKSNCKNRKLNLSISLPLISMLILKKCATVLVTIIAITILLTNTHYHKKILRYIAKYFAR